MCKECYELIYEQYKPTKYAEKICECGREVKVMRVHLKSKLHNQWIKLRIGEWYMSTSSAFTNTIPKT